MKGPQRAPLQPTERPAVKRIFFLVIAWISLALGCIGVFVPLLPTTPLVLLATFLFAKSSPRLHAWICKTRVYGAYVKPFKERGGITLARKLQLRGLRLRKFYKAVYQALCRSVSFVSSAKSAKKQRLGICLGYARRVFWAVSGAPRPTGINAKKGRPKAPQMSQLCHSSVTACRSYAASECPSILPVSSKP